MLRLGNTNNHPSFSMKQEQVFSYKDTDMSVYRAVVEANRLHEKETALIFMGRRISYRQLIEQADVVSDIMTSMNIRRGEMILLGANNPQAVSILLACSKIGAGAMILTQRTTPSIFAQTVSSMDIPLMFCTNDVYVSFSERKEIDEVSQIVILPADKPIGEDTSEREFNKSTSNVCTWDAFLNYQITETAEEVQGGYFPLTISASTGTTGNPKGIVMENRSFIALLKIVQCVKFDWRRGDILSSTLSTGVATGTSLLLLIPLMMGLTVLQHPRYPMKNPFASFLEESAAIKANILVSPPSLWMAMIAAHPENLNLSAVRHSYTIGEPVSDIEYHVINGFLKKNKAGDRLRNMYGMSELNSIATYAPDTSDNPTCAGTALPYNTISVFDHDTLREKEYGETGEVFIMSPTAMREYIYDPIETKSFFERDNLGRKWARTGDLGIISQTGELTILGRISQRFLAKDGTCIYPYMIERILLKVPEVTRVKMVNMNYGGEAVYAVHVIPENPSEDKRKLAEKLFDIIMSRKEITIPPKAIKIRDSFPKNQGGKVDIQKMAQEKDDFYIR